MNNSALNASFDVENWKSELSRMLSTAATEEERTALEAFAKAMTPYLNNPVSLRTVLGKIQRTFLAPEVQNEIENGTFSSLDEISSLLPDGVNVRVESHA